MIILNQETVNAIISSLISGTTHTHNSWPAIGVSEACNIIHSIAVSKDEIEIARQKVYQYITQEFLAQDDKWGALRDQSGYIWLAGIMEEVGEASETLLKDQHWYLTKAELIQVGALVVNWIVSAEHWLDQHKEEE